MTHLKGAVWGSRHALCCTWPVLSSFLTEVKQPERGSQAPSAEQSGRQLQVTCQTTLQPEQPANPSRACRSSLQPPQVLPHPARMHLTWYMWRGAWAVETRKTCQDESSAAACWWSLPISYHHRNFTGFLPSPVIPITMSVQTHTILGLSVVADIGPPPCQGRMKAKSPVLLFPLPVLASPMQK